MESRGSSLPQAAVLPFVERDGIWWGPPPDDATAVEELKRLRQAGAEHIAFIWSTFWWLEHYKAFADALKSGHAIHNDANVRILSLRR